MIIFIYIYQIILKHKENANMILLFVKERIIVKYLNQLINEFVKHTDFKNLHSNYVLGAHNNTLHKKEYKNYYFY